MFVASLCQQLCADKLPVPLGERLGDGADGEVLTIMGQPDRVIKLGIIYDNPSRGLGVYKDIQRVLDYLIATPTEAHVRVYERGFLGTYSRYVHQGEQEFLMYYYIMEKLEKISEDERKVFHSILSHEDRKIVKNYSADQIKEMLHGMSQGLDFDQERVILFCQRLKQAPISHRDLHVRNIMKDAVGDFRLIDLDRAVMENNYAKNKG